MKVVIVGGGFGGVKTALELANKPDIDVQLITQHQNFEYHGALYRSATGHSPKEVVLPLSEIFEDATNIEVVLDTVLRVNDQAQSVTGELGETYHYDYLVMALGNTINYFDISGMDKHSFSMDTIASTLKLREELVKKFKKLAPKPVSIVVIGAGASGTELAGELKHFAWLVAWRHHQRARSVEVTLIEGADRVLPALHPKASAKAGRRLKKLGVKVRLNTRVNSCEPNKVCLNKSDITADIIIWTAGSTNAPLFAKHPYVFDLDRGRVKVDEKMHPVNQPHMYVIGDNAATPYSGMAQTALRDAIYVAQDILANQAQRRHAKYRAIAPVYVVPVGPKWAIYQKGNLVRSGLFGWRARRQADLEVFKNFEPYAKAVELWAAGNEMIDF